MRPDQLAPHWAVELSGGQEEFQAGVPDTQISGIFVPLSPCSPVCSLCPLRPFPCGNQQYKPSKHKGLFVFPGLSCKGEAGLHSEQKSRVGGWKGDGFCSGRKQITAPERLKRSVGVGASDTRPWDGWGPADVVTRGPSPAP